MKEIFRKKAAKLQVVLLQDMTELFFHHQPAGVIVFIGHNVSYAHAKAWLPTLQTQVLFAHSAVVRTRCFAQWSDILMNALIWEQRIS